MGTAATYEREIKSLKAQFQKSSQRGGSEGDNSFSKHVMTQ